MNCCSYLLPLVQHLLCARTHSYTARQSKQDCIFKNANISVYTMSTPRRFGRKNRSSSKLGAEDASGDPTKRIKELEKALEERDKTIAEQKDKIKELSNEIDYRKRLVDDLTEERNALRRKNSNIVGKLAELSRKQSVSSFMSSSPPQLPKRLEG